jgi:hypothetical protein
VFTGADQCGLRPFRNGTAPTSAAGRLRIVYFYQCFNDGERSLLGAAADIHYSFTMILRGQTG